MYTAKDYYEMGAKVREQAASSAAKQTLLLHVCCAPCNAFPLEWLAPYFEITIFYNNSNIYPGSEYVRRRDEVLQYVERWNQENANSVQVIEMPYDNDEFTAFLSPLKDEPEGGMRCMQCYARRMREGFTYANSHNFAYFTTVMTISRQKDSVKINQIGEALQSTFPTTKYLFSNFKKKGGYERGMALSKQHQLYRQTYCGCRYSYEARK